MNIDVNLMLTIAAGVLLAFTVKHVVSVVMELLFGYGPIKTKSGGSSFSPVEPGKAG